MPPCAFPKALGAREEEKAGIQAGQVTGIQVLLSWSLASPPKLLPASSHPQTSC